MPLITDLLARVTDSSTGRPVVSTLASPGKAVGATSISISDATNWTTTTPVHFAIYTTNAQGYKNPLTQTEWKGVLSGTTISNLTLTGGTDQSYTTGAIVDVTPTSRWGKDLYDALNVHTNADGSLKATAVQTALGIGNASNTGWIPIGYSPSFVQDYGQKEALISFPADVTAFLGVGDKVQIPRSVAPPTQCMAFTAASNQYATNPSPTGITFSGAFTCEAWVYLISYTGQNQTVIARRNGSAGAWWLRISPTGQVGVGYGDGAANFTEQVSYQAVPLQRWVHIAGVVGNVGTKTMTIYINGLAVPSVLSLGGATTLVQAGNLSIGTYGGGGGDFFNGYISEARVWNNANSQATIQQYRSINLTGSENLLVALFQGNGNFNDKTTNANNLTALNGASATQTFSTVNGGTSTQPTFGPMNSNEYGVITKIAPYSAGATQVTVFTGTECNIPNDAMGPAYYSQQRSPLGFPADKNKWTVDLSILNAVSIPGSSTSTIYNPGGIYMTLPVGVWTIKKELISLVSPSNSSLDVTLALSTSATMFTLPKLSSRIVTNLGTTSAAQITLHNKSDSLVTTTPTNLYILFYSIAPFSPGNTYIYGMLNTVPAVSTVLAICEYI